MSGSEGLPPRLDDAVEGLEDVDEGLDVEDGQEFNESVEEDEEEEDSSDKLPVLDAEGDDEETEEEDREEGEIRSGDSEEEERLKGGGGEVKEDESKLATNPSLTKSRSSKISEKVVGQDSNESAVEMPVLSPAEVKPEVKVSSSTKEVDVGSLKEVDETLEDEATTEDDVKGGVGVTKETTAAATTTIAVPDEKDNENAGVKEEEEVDDDDDDHEVKYELKEKVVSSPKVEHLSSTTDEAADDVVDVEKQTTKKQIETMTERELICDIAKQTREASVVLRKVVIDDDVKFLSQPVLQQQQQSKSEELKTKTRKSWSTRKRSRDSADIASSSSQFMGRGGGGEGGGGAGAEGSAAAVVVVVVPAADVTEELIGDAATAASPMVKSGEETSLKRQKTDGKE